MTEEWRDIIGYEGHYQVSNHGRVRSVERTMHGRVWPAQMKAEATHYKGHKKVWLSKDNIRMRYFVHRLVAFAFIPEVEGKPVVNHKDGVKSNNHVENLEWMTVLENNLHKIGMKDWPANDNF